jgi:hypothetical protein
MYENGMHEIEQTLPVGHQSNVFKPVLRINA